MFFRELEKSKDVTFQLLLADGQFSGRKVTVLGNNSADAGAEAEALRTNKRFPLLRDYFLLLLIHHTPSKIEEAQDHHRWWPATHHRLWLSRSIQ